MREVLAVCGVLLMLGAAVAWLRRRTPRAGGRRLAAVERLALSPHHSLHLVRLAGRGLLIGVSPAGCALLESGDWSRFEPPASQMETRS